jgi:hypothetical protein
MRRLVFASMLLVVGVVALVEPASTAPREISCSVRPSTVAPGGEATVTIAGGEGTWSVRQFVDGTLIDSATTSESSMTVEAPPAGDVTVQVYSLTVRSNHPGGSTVYRDKLAATCGYSVG